MASSRSAAGSGAKISPQMSPTSARCTAPVGWARAWGWLGVGCCTHLCVFMVFSFLFVLLAFTPEWEPLPHILLDGQVMRVGPPGISFGGPGWGGCPESYRNGGGWPGSGTAERTPKGSEAALKTLRAAVSGVKGCPTGRTPTAPSQGPLTPLLGACGTGPDQRQCGRIREPGRGCEAWPYP